MMGVRQGWRSGRIILVECPHAAHSKRFLVTAGLLGLFVLSWPGTSSYSAEPSVPAAGQTAIAPGTMAVPLRLIADARQSYQTVRDYSCLFVRRERLRGELQEESLIAMGVRTQRFSVYMRWLKPSSLVGQEVCYVAGRNNGMMRAQSTGILGVAGFVSLAPNDPRVFENSRHTVVEAGIGHLIDCFSESWERENRSNKTVLRIADFDYNKRRCVRVETIHPDNSGRESLFYRSLVYFDKEHHLPIRVENFDWPRQGGDPEGMLVESYSYANLRLNVGLSDAIFNH